MRAITITIDGLVLDTAECTQLGPVLLRAAELMRNTGDHHGADLTARLALAAAAVAARVAADTPHVAAPGSAAVAVVPLTTWARRNGTPQRTARRWAASGRLGAVKRHGRWLVLDDHQQGPTAA